MTDLYIDPTLSVPLAEFRITAIRASGPGGQHVNKTSTAIQVRYDVDNSAALPAAVRERLKLIAGNRLTADGELIVTAQRFRSRRRNQQDALERIAKLIRRATVVPKKRRRSVPPARSRRRRLEDKKKRGKLKKLRGRPDDG